MAIRRGQVKGIPKIVIFPPKMPDFKINRGYKKFLKKVLADSKSFMYSDLRL
jgi:hypothetical protein